MMTCLYFLGGFSQDTTKEDLVQHLEKNLDVEGLDDVWFDPRRERRAVFLCPEQLDIRKIQEQLTTNPLNDKLLFCGEEKETELLYVEVPSMKCKALIDKLPLLFHQRKNGGSKITNIVEIRDNNFKLTFQDGWGAVVGVMKSKWYIGDTEVTITPFFASFQEAYKTQKKRCKPSKRKESTPDNEDRSKDANTNPAIPLKPSGKQVAEQEKPTVPSKPFGKKVEQDKPQVPSEVSIPSCNQTVEQKKPAKGPKIKTMLLYTDIPFCVLLSCLSFAERIRERFPTIQVNIDMEEGNISLKGPDPPLTKVQSLIIDQETEIKCEDNWRDEFGLFLHYDNYEQLCQYMDNSHIVLCLEENEGVQLAILRDAKKLSLLEFVASEIHLVQKLSCPEAVSNKDFNGFLSRFNSKHFDFKIDLDMTQTTTLKLFHFGRVVDSNNMSNLLSEIRNFLQDETSVKQTIAKASVEKTAEPQKTRTESQHSSAQSPKPVIPEIRNFLQDETSVKQTIAKASVEKTAEPQKTRTESQHSSAQSPKPVIPHKKHVEKIGLRPELLVFLRCLSLDKKIQEFCATKAQFIEEDVMITLRGMPADVAELKNMLFSLNEFFPENDFVMELGKFLASDENRELLKSCFELHLKKKERDEIGVYIQDRNNKKETFEVFTSAILDQVKQFSLSESPSKPDERKSFLEQFNSKQHEYRLIDMNYNRTLWLLLKLTYDDNDQLIQEIQRFVSRSMSMKMEGTQSTQLMDSGGDVANEGFSDSGNEDFHDAHDSIDNNDACHQQDENNPCAYYTLKYPAIEFLSNPWGCLSLEKELKGLVWDVKLNGYQLNFACKNHNHDYFDALASYQKELKCETITLKFPGLKEFRESPEGQKLFKEMEKIYVCALVPSREHGGGTQSGSSGSEKLESRYKVALLETVMIGTNAYFHLCQGDGRNINGVGSIHICLPNRPDDIRRLNVQGNNKMQLFLPPWSLEESRQGEREFTERLDVAFARASSWRHICISVGSGYAGRAPCLSLARAVIACARKAFGSSQQDTHIFLCELKSAPLLKAFQYVLNGSTVAFRAPDDVIWQAVTDQVSSKHSYPEYPKEVKFAVAQSWEDTISKHSLVCFPILTPLEESSSAFKETFRHDWMYARAMKTLEGERPDGLLDGEVFVYHNSPLRACDAALYGCQSWDIDVKKTLQKILENCFDAGIKGRYDSLSIIVPGTSLPCFYPKAWLASKWFEHLDGLVKHQQKHKFTGTIHFVVQEAACHSLFKEYLNRRERGYLSKFKGKSASSNPPKKPAVEFTVITHKNSVHKKVENDLNEEMEKLMRKNQKQEILTASQHEKLKEHFQSNFKIRLIASDVKKKKKSKKEKLMKWDIYGLTKELVHNALSKLNIQLGKPPSSSVDTGASANSSTARCQSAQKSVGTEDGINHEKWNQNYGRQNSNSSNKFPDDILDMLANSGEACFSSSTESQSQPKKESAMKAGGRNQDFQSHGRQNSNSSDNVPTRMKGPQRETSLQTGLEGTSATRLETPMETEVKSSGMESKEIDPSAMPGNKRQKEEDKLLKNDISDRNSVSNNDKNERTKRGGGREDTLLGAEIPHRSNPNTNASVGKPIPDVRDFQWYYHDQNNTTVIFDEDESERLETAYREAASFLINGMNVNLSTMIAKSEDDNLKQFAVSRHELLKVRHMKKPDHWTDDDLIKLKKKEHPDYREVDDDFDERWHVKKIERVQNLELFKQYQTKKRELGETSEEKVMWQRIDEDYKSRIVTYGCHKSFMTLRCDQMGDSICFASQVEDCVLDNDGKRGKHFTLVRCRVCLGEEGKDKGQPSLRFPPSGYSSVSDEKFSMVFSSVQVYPTHFVQVQWTDDDDDADE